MSTTHTGSIRSESRLSNADSDSSSDHYQVQPLYQDQQPPSEPSMNSKYTTRPISMMPATKALNVQGGVKLRPRSLVVYTTQLPPMSDDSSQFSGSSSASDSSSTASSRSSAQEPAALKRYTLTDNPVRMQPHSQPAHRSKLSKQYTPSESEGSDDDRSDQAQSQRRRPRATGGPKELSSSVAAESLRAISRMDMNQAQPSSLTSESTETLSLNSVKKKMSFAKRISRLFGASKSTKIPSTATQPATIAPASAAPPSSRASAKSDPHRSSAISRAGTPSLEVIDELGGQELRRPQVYMHPRSQSSPNIVRRNGQSMCNNSGSNGNVSRYSMMAQDASGLKTRDNGFEDDEASGHRRYSSANGPSTSASGVGSRVSAVNPIQRQRALSANKYPTIGNRSSLLVGGHMYADQQQPQHADHYDNKHDSSGTPPSPHSRHPSDTDTGGALGMIAPLSEDQKRQRRATILDAPPHLVYQPQMTAPSRRSSTPVVISETLVSRIDREKSTKCFQTPVPVRDTYSRDAKLDPALSNLVQQHRKDYQVNTRLGGSVTQTSQAQVGPLTVDTSLLSLRDRDARAGTHRRDSSGSQSHSSYSPHQHPIHMGTPPTPVTPGSYPAVEGHARRLSGGQPQLPAHPYPSGHRGTFTGSHGNLLNAAALASVKQQQQQHQQQQQQQQQHRQQPSPPFTPHGTYNSSQGRHRTTPQRQSSASYFSLPLQQQQQFSASVTNISPFPSPVLGATPTSTATLGCPPELSVAMQHQQYQQQQVQLHIQQQQLQQLQTQQHIVQQQLPQQGYYQAVSPLALLQHQQQHQHNQQQQHQQQQHQQNQQQQLEHLQHIRIQQQQILLQQQQQLQQQLEQTRAVVTAAAAATASASAATATTTPNAVGNSATALAPSTVSITTPAPLSQPELLQQQQQQQQSMMNRATMHFGLPAAPVLTTAMGLGMGMGMDPMGMSNMNLLGMGGVPMGVNMNMLSMGAGPSPNLVPQLLMTPQLTPQMMAYPNMYSYQPAAGLGTGGGSMAMAAAAGGSMHAGA